MSRTDRSGDYPIVVSEPDGRFFARPVDPDEGYEEFGWVVIDAETGGHVANCDEVTAGVVVDALNRAGAYR